MKQIIKIVAVLIMLAMVASVSAQVEIRAADGSELPTVTYVGDTLTVKIMDNDVPVVSGANVMFILAEMGGDPTVVPVNDLGQARYKPYVRGELTIRVLDGVTTVAEDTITVDDEPWVPVIEPTKKSYRSGGGGGYVPQAPTNDTNTTVNNSVADVVPRQTIAPVVPTVAPTEVVEVVPVVEEAPKPVPTPKAPESSSVPGFEAVFAIAGILGVVYLYRRH